MAETETQETMRRALLRLMGDLSEEQWAAGWLVGLGPSLWASLYGENFGSRFALSAEEKTDLRNLSDMAGGWWDWPDDADEPVFFSSNEWNARYRAIREGAA